MFLYELEMPDHLVIKLVAITKQLKSEIDQGKEKDNWTVSELLSFYQSNGINIPRSEIYDMIKQPPLDKFISNIQGNEIKFKGQSDDQPMTDKDENQKVVSKMARDAMK